MKDIDMPVVHMIHRKTLEAADADRLVFGIEDACTFAEFLNRTDAGARGADQVRFQNRAGRADDVGGRDLLDEARDIDMGRARMGAGRVVAVEASVRLDQRFVSGQWGILLSHVFPA